MTWSEALQTELGAVLLHADSRRVCIVVERIPLPLERISVQYLDGDGERIEGCAPEKFGKAVLRAGTELRESATGRRARLCGDTRGPEARVRFADTDSKERRVFCEPSGKRWVAAFSIMPESERNAVKRSL